MWHRPLHRANSRRHRQAKVIAIGVSIDKPAVDPKRHVAVLNGLREEIFRVPVYSKPSINHT